VSIQVGEPVPTDEKFDLYAKYCARWHEHKEAETREGFERFLYQSPVDSIEFTFRVGDRLVGTGICDICERSLSSVYFYFDPDEAGRSLGTFSTLCEIDFAREHGIPHWYAGFWIRDCPAMTYKANFGPAEVLGMDGKWRPLYRDEKTLSS
jgi:arginine-tRNA-protein transferase